MPVHCTAVAGDCDRLLLLLRLDAQTGDKMREALKEEMVEVCIKLYSFCAITFHTLASSSKLVVFIH